MKVGLINKPNIFYPVLFFFHLVIKAVAHFYLSPLILLRQFLLNVDVIQEKLQVQFQHRDCAHPYQTQLLGASSKEFIWTSSSRHADIVNVLWNSGSSGSSRYPFVNIVNSSINLKLLYNLPCYLSIWSLSNCKMALIMSLDLNNSCSIKVEFHQFPFLIDFNGHLQ